MNIEFYNDWEEGTVIDFFKIGVTNFRLFDKVEVVISVFIFGYGVDIELF